MQDVTRRGTVYGTLLNHHDALAALGDAIYAAPYKAAPKAPILYIKPRNTWLSDGQSIVVPEGVDALEIGATVGVVIGRTACRVAESEALSFVAGYVIVNDVSVPHPSYYRPSLRFKARDTFCPIGELVSADAVADPNAFAITVAIDDQVVARSSTAKLIRPVAKLLADVTEFMTLSAGDVISIGVAANAPHARAGQHVAISVDGLGSLRNPLVAESNEGRA